MHKLEYIGVILSTCMGLKPTERLLIITDANKRALAEPFFDEASQITRAAKLIEIPESEHHGQEPPRQAAEEMKRSDVVLLITSKSYSHTKARREATAAGARIASMPGVTQDMLERCIAVDYAKMTERTNKLCDILDKGKKVTITTKKGTKLTMSIEGRQAHGRKAGIFTGKGAWGNLPEGEACLAPLEGTTEGKVVVDASVAKLGKVDKPITITIKGGYAEKIEGGITAVELAKLLYSVGHEAQNIAELGIGTNDLAIISGDVLEDEKVMGTCHIAFGNNMSMEGHVDVPIHIDVVMTQPTILVDGKKIMNEGKLLK